MKIPSEEEQRIAECYVLHRPLIRPDTDIKKAIRCFAVYLLISNAAAILSYTVLSRLGIFYLLPESVSSFRKSHDGWFMFIYFLIVFAMTAAICLKKAVIGAIKLYQHYAPEHMRRRCLFKPTCSEYAILAVEKYGVIRGLHKAYIRLFKKCRGKTYGIDYP